MTDISHCFSCNKSNSQFINLVVQNETSVISERQSDGSKRKVSQQAVAYTLRSFQYVFITYIFLIIGYNIA